MTRPEASAEGFVFEVRVQPRARREGVAGFHAGALKIALHAPPVDGAANQALVALLARELGLRKNEVEILSGESSRRKRIRVPQSARAKVEDFLAAARKG